MPSLEVILSKFRDEPCLAKNSMMELSGGEDRPILSGSIAACYRQTDGRGLYSAARHSIS